MAMNEKLTEALITRCRSLRPDDRIEVVLELTAPEEALLVGPRGRAERRAAKKASFERSASDLERTIHQVGGRVVARAWLNHTVQVQLPAHALADLTALALVRSVDLPHTMTREHR
jgi:predicted aminopeptidase